LWLCRCVLFYIVSLPDISNVMSIVGASVWDTLLFSYTTKVVMLGNVAESLDIGDLPIVPADMRATFNYAAMKRAGREIKLRIGSWSPKPGSGWSLLWRLARLNAAPLTWELCLASVAAVLFYTPAIFLQRLVAYLEADSGRTNMGWGWVYVFGLFMSNAITYLSEFFMVAIIPLWDVDIFSSHWSIMVLGYYHDTSSSPYPAQFYPFCQDARS
jgi:hypothetical protein